MFASFWKGAANDRLAAPHKVSSPLFIFTHTTTSGDSQILHNGNLIHSLKFKFVPILLSSCLMYF